MKKLIVLLVLALLLVPASSIASGPADAPDSRYYRVRTETIGDGTVLAATLIAGPPEPPPGYMRATPERVVSSAAEGVVILSNVPTFDWSFGCSATSAAMIAGYYDRTGYPNMYAGPTNGGLMPLTNSSWPDWHDGTDLRSQCPLSATHQGLDGRVTKGHVDDYWIVYGNGGPDPFIDNWPEHTYGEGTGDYMKTNQSEYGNVDGGTTFYNYTDGSRIYDYQMVSHGIEDIDGGYGLKLFYESRGYDVTNMFNQYILGWASPTLGFTWAQYKAEIDAGRPVMIHVQGHTMVGIGYDDAANQMYIHDTWDYSVHTMTWGGSYSGMAHYGVTIVQLAPNVAPPAAPSGLVATASGTEQIDLTWVDNSSDETGFMIERSLDASAWTQVGGTGANSTSYQDSGLAEDTTYYYRVYAYSTGGNSGYSNQSSATTFPDTTPPAPPAGLTATGGDGVVYLDWNANGEPDLAGYTVYRATTSGELYTTLTSLPSSATSYSDNSVSNGTTYYYVVTASDGSGNESGDSNEASATPAEVQASIDLAAADHAIYGSVSGTYEATHAQDGSFQSIMEMTIDHKLEKQRYDRLEHIWRFDLTGGNHIFHVDAYYVDAGDLDSGFDFSWATSLEGPWNPLLTVTANTDDPSYQTADLGSTAGTIYVRATDNNRKKLEVSNDTLYIDRMYIDGGAPPTDPPGQAANPNPANGATEVSTTPTVTWSAGVGATSHDVYFDSGSGLLFQGNQAGTSFSPGTLQLDTTYRWRIDEVNDVGTTTGDEWSFTTSSSTGPVSMHVDSIVVATAKGPKGALYGQATVVVVDDWGDPVVGASVTGTFTGDLNETLSKSTGTGGSATLTTSTAVKRPAYTFCVDTITYTGLTYNNAVTCASYP